MRQRLFLIVDFRFPFQFGRYICKQYKIVRTENLHLLFDLQRLACVLVLLTACLSAETPGATADATDSEPLVVKLETVPRVPGVSSFLHGLNAGVSFSQVHDSSIGWYNVVTPAVSFNFSDHFSADASLSIYPYRKITTLSPPPLPTEKLVVERGDLGDMMVGLHASFNSRTLWNTTTAFMTLPTGNRSAGLSTSRVTYDFSNHVERYFGRTGLLLDIGAGDSSGGVNNLVTKTYTSLGPLSHYQAGAVVWFSSGSYIQSVAYEQLPMGGQTVYTDQGPDGQTHTILYNNSASEDNGFTTSVGIPLTSHLTLSSYYNRSLRRHLDTTSFGITYVWRGTSRKRRLSLVDRALQEAETEAR